MLAAFANFDRWLPSHSIDGPTNRLASLVVFAGAGKSPFFSGWVPDGGSILRDLGRLWVSLIPVNTLCGVSSPATEVSVESSETEGEETEKADSETKRRRVRDIGSSIVHSTTLLSQTLKCYEEKKEKRHRELMELEEQRLRLEETRNEVNRQGIAGLVTSINKLSDAIHSLISEKRGKP